MSAIVLGAVAVGAGIWAQQLYPDATAHPVITAITMLLPLGLIFGGILLRDATRWR